MAQDWLSRSWLFEIVNSETSRIDESFTLILPPKSYTIKEKGRVAITKTFGNAFIDDYGPDNLEITIKAISGTSHVFPTFQTKGTSAFTNVSKQSALGLLGDPQTATKGYTGRSAFYTFRDTIMRYRDKPNYDKKELRVYDLYDEQAYKCILLDFTLDRQAEQPFWYPFTINLFVYARLDSKSVGKPEKIAIGKDPFDIIAKMNEKMEWFNNTARTFQTVINAGATVQNNINLLSAKINNYITTARTIAETPLTLSKQLIDSVKTMASTIRDVQTQGKMLISDYANFAEVAQGLLRNAHSIYGYSIEQGAQTLREEVLPVDAGVNVDNDIQDRDEILERYSFSGVNIYTVKEADTLQSIALQEMGDVDLWPFIAMINSTIYGNANLYAGLEIYVPEVTEASLKDTFIMTEDALRDPYGQDIRIDEDGNLVFQENNDIALISGISNVQQAVDLRLNTVVGSMIKQTAFGLSAGTGLPGTTQAISYIRMGMKWALIQDPRISSVTNVNVTIDGSEIAVSMDVGVVGRDTTLPVSVTF